MVWFRKSDNFSSAFCTSFELWFSRRCRINKELDLVIHVIVWLAPNIMSNPNGFLNCHCMVKNLQVWHTNNSGYIEGQSSVNCNCLFTNRVDIVSWNSGFWTHLDKRDMEKTYMADNEVIKRYSGVFWISYNCNEYRKKTQQKVIKYI